MKKTFLFLLTLLFCPILIQAKGAPKRADFSGKWVLDTGRTRNLPNGLQSYSMVVSQDRQRLKVLTTLRGNLRPMSSPNQPYPGNPSETGSPDSYPGGSPNGYPNGGTGPMGMPGRVGMGMPSGRAEGPMSEGIPGTGLPGTTGRRPRSEGGSRARIAAFMLYPRSAIYKLDGGESTAQLGGPMHSDAALKANWAKNGKALKLSLTGSGYRGQVQMKDQWKLSKDGKSLVIDRSVETPHGSGSIHLVFQKRNSHSAALVGQSHLE
ncbi:MAG TPA: hypothetical protein VKV79_06620 [Terriglobia bacterium]|nr:hypothetical protein [Terriglobia bacterium]